MFQWIYLFLAFIFLMKENGFTDSSAGITSASLDATLSAENIGKCHQFF